MSLWKLTVAEFAKIAQKADNFSDFLKGGGKFVRDHIKYTNPGSQRLTKEVLGEMGNRVDRLKILGKELANADYFFRRLPDEGILSGLKKQPHLELVGPGNTREGVASLINYGKVADDVAFKNRHNINLEHEKYLELENKFINTMLQKVHLMSAKDFDDFLFRVKEFRRIGNSMSSTAKGDDLIDNPALHDLALKNRDLRIKGPPDDEIHSINKFIENVVNDPEGFYKIGPLLDKPFGIPSDRWLTFHKGSKGTKVPGEDDWGKGPGRFSAEEEIVTEGGNPFIAEEGIKGLQKEVVTEIRSPFTRTGIKTLEEKQADALKDLMGTKPINLFATEKEFAEDLYSTTQNYIKNSPDFNIQLAKDLQVPGPKTYGWTPSGDLSRRLSPNQRQTKLDKLKEIMQSDEYKGQFGEYVLEDDIFKIKKAQGGRIGFAEGSKEFLQSDWANYKARGGSKTYPEYIIHRYSLDIADDIPFGGGLGTLFEEKG